MYLVDRVEIPTPDLMSLNNMALDFYLLLALLFVPFCFLSVCRMNLWILKAEINSVAFSEGKGSILSTMQGHTPCLLVPLTSALNVCKSREKKTYYRYFYSHEMNIDTGKFKVQFHSLFVVFSYAY